MHTCRTIAEARYRCKMEKFYVQVLRNFPVEINSGQVERRMEPLKRNTAGGGWRVVDGGWWMVDGLRLLLALIKINRYTKRKRPAEAGMQPAATGGRKSTSDTTAAATVGGQNFRSEE